MEPDPFCSPEEDLRFKWKKLFSEEAQEEHKKAHGLFREAQEKERLEQRASPALPEYKLTACEAETIKQFATTFTVMGHSSRSGNASYTHFWYPLFGDLYVRIAPKLESTLCDQDTWTVVWNTIIPPGYKALREADEQHKQVKTKNLRKSA